MDSVLREPGREGLFLDTQEFVPALARVLDGEPCRRRCRVRQPRFNHGIRRPVEELRQGLGKLDGALPERLQATAEDLCAIVAAVDAEAAVRVHPGIAKQAGPFLGQRKDLAGGLDAPLCRPHGQPARGIEQRDQYGIEPPDLVEE